MQFVIFVWVMLSNRLFFFVKAFPRVRSAYKLPLCFLPRSQTAKSGNVKRHCVWICLVSANHSRTNKWVSTKLIWGKMAKEKPFTITTAFCSDKLTSSSVKRLLPSTQTLTHVHITQIKHNQYILTQSLPVHICWYVFFSISHKHSSSKSGLLDFISHIDVFLQWFAIF